jgi:hypothetical protein
MADGIQPMGRFRRTAAPRGCGAAEVAGVALGAGCHARERGLELRAGPRRGHAEPSVR